MPPNLSKDQILNHLQCPRRFWLEQYHPEVEGDATEMEAALDAEEVAAATARALYTGDGIVAISGRLGLRSAIEQTGNALEKGVIVLDATFEHEGISARIDIVDWTGDSHRAISVTAAAQISTHHIENCAIQSWVLSGLGITEHRHIIGMRNAQSSDGASFSDAFSLEDVTDRVSAELAGIEPTVNAARALHASLNEPADQTGPHCRKPGYACPFLEYCDQR
jgi:hypothetical protein